VESRVALVAVLHQKKLMRVDMFRCFQSNMSSTYTMEKVLTDAKSLVMRLKDYDTTTNNLLTQTQELGKKVDAMKTVIFFILHQRLVIYIE